MRSGSGSSLDSQQRVASNDGMERVEAIENKIDQEGVKTTILLPDIDWVKVPAGELVWLLSTTTVSGLKWGQAATNENPSG